MSTVSAMSENASKRARVKGSSLAAVMLAIAIFLPATAWASPGFVTVAQDLSASPVNWFVTYAGFGDLPDIRSTSMATSASQIGLGAHHRGVAWDGQWHTIFRGSDGKNYFATYATYADMVANRSASVEVGVLSPDVYRGLAYDGSAWHTVAYSGGSNYWQTYASFRDVATNKAISTIVNARAGSDIYRGIAYCPLDKGWYSVAKGTDGKLYFVSYRNYSELTIIVPLTSASRSIAAEYYALGWGDPTPGASWPSSTQAATNLDLYLVMGQSNAVGFKADGRNVSGDTTPFFYREGSGTNVLDSNGVTTLKPQTSAQVFSWGTGFGPELGLAERLRARGVSGFGVLKYAWSSTGLADRWDPARADLFLGFQVALADALAAFRAKGYQPRVAGLLWMQGESDALDQANAQAYRQNLGRFSSALRAVAADSYLPIVVGRISKSTIWTFGKVVRGAQADLATAEPDRTFLVETSDLSLDIDKAHYVATSELSLGRRAGDLFASQCQVLADTYGITPNVDFGFAPPAVQARWKAAHCNVAPSSSDSCQNASELFGIEAGVTFGFAPSTVQSWWTSRGCNTKPLSSIQLCQRASDVYGMSLQSAGTAPIEVQAWWASHGCQTSARLQTTCQKLSDLFGMSPSSAGFPTSEAAAFWRSSACATSPVVTNTCQLLSDNFGLSPSESKGAAHDAARKFWTSQGCKTSPTSSNTCQRASDLYGIVGNVTFGAAPAEVRSWWSTANCRANPRSLDTCQAAANRFGIEANITFGAADVRVQTWWATAGCDTIPRSTAPLQK